MGELEPSSPGPCPALCRRLPPSALVGAFTESRAPYRQLGLGSGEEGGAVPGSQPFPWPPHFNPFN